MSSVCHDGFKRQIANTVRELQKNTEVSICFNIHFYFIIPKGDRICHCSTFEQMQTALLAEYQALLASRRVNLGVTSSSGSTQQLDNESTDRSNLQGSNEVDMLLLQFHQSVQRLSRSVDSSMSQLDTRCITSTFSSEFLSKTQGDFDADPSDLKALCLELDRSKESDTVCDELNGVGSTASLADHLSEASVSHVLEKYSDRLVELVTEKLKLSK